MIRAATSTHGATSDASRVLERRGLPSGRVLLVRRGPGPDSEELELLAPNGDVEVRILCGPGGPQVIVHATRLEVDAPSLAVRCRELDLEAAEGVALRSQGELRVETAGDIHLNGDVIRLNCTDVPTPSNA